MRLGSTSNVQEAMRESGWGDAVTQLRRPFSVWRAQADRRAGQQQTCAYAQVATFHVHAVRSCGMLTPPAKQIIDTRACCRGLSPAKKYDIMLAGVILGSTCSTPFNCQCIQESSTGWCQGRRGAGRGAKMLRNRWTDHARQGQAGKSVQHSWQRLS